MKKIKLTTIALGIALLVSSCGTSQGNGTLIGAGGGAALGAIAGRLIGGNSRGTAIGAALGAAAGSVAGNLIGKHMDKVKAEAAAKLANAKVSETTDINGLPAVKVTFDSGILFATNKSDLNATAKNELTKFAEVLKNNADCFVAVQGHTDSTGSDAINNPLSVSRAESVTNFLVSKGASSSQFKVVEGYGSTKPVADNSTADGRKQNRRVEVFLYASDAMIQAAQNGTLK